MLMLKVLISDGRVSECFHYGTFEPRETRHA